MPYIHTHSIKATSINPYRFEVSGLAQKPFSNIGCCVSETGKDREIARSEGEQRHSENTLNSDIYNYFNNYNSKPGDNKQLF